MVGVGGLREHWAALTPCAPPLPESTCAVQHKHQVIRLQGCSSAGPVRLAYCQGNCGDTASMYVSARPLPGPGLRVCRWGGGGEEGRKGKQ